MNLVKQQQLFESRYLVQDDNVFEAINKWSLDSAKLKAQYQGKLSNSEALSSSLTGILPYNIARRKLVKDVESQYVNKYIRESLAQVDDKDVRISVLRSLEESKLEKNLVFVYLNKLSSAQKARVRIICKLIWFNLYPKKGKKDV